MTITLTREEAQQVLDAFLSMGQRAYDAMSGDAFHECNIAVSRLRTRLAQPEPETCGYDETTGNCTQNPCCYPAPPQLEPSVEPVACIVKDCENHKHQGHFVGDLCSPCHAFITRNEGKYSQAYRNAQREWQGLTDKERNDCLVEADPCEALLDHEAHELMRTVEAKLKEKNGG